MSSMEVTVFKIMDDNSTQKDHHMIFVQLAYTQWHCEERL